MRQIDKWLTQWALLAGAVVGILTLAYWIPWWGYDLALWLTERRDER